MNFNLLIEPNLKAIKISGEFGYNDKQKFSLLASINYTQFTAQNMFSKAYGILPLEVNSSIRYQIFKDIKLKTDISFWDGAAYRFTALEDRKGISAIDLSFGAEFKATKKLNIYIDFNNLFNNEYQRWNQYNVFGFNLIGGVVYSLY